MNCCKRRRGRLLAFEQFEPRVVLSASTSLPVELPLLELRQSRDEALQAATQSPAVDVKIVDGGFLSFDSSFDRLRANAVDVNGSLHLFDGGIANAWHGDVFSSEASDVVTNDDARAVSGGEWKQIPIQEPTTEPGFIDLGAAVDVPFMPPSAADAVHADADDLLQPPLRTSNAAIENVRGRAVVFELASSSALDRPGLTVAAGKVRSNAPASTGAETPLAPTIDAAIEQLYAALGRNDAEGEPVRRVWTRPEQSTVDSRVASRTTAPEALDRASSGAECPATRVAMPPSEESPSSVIPATTDREAAPAPTPQDGPTAPPARRDARHKLVLGALIAALFSADPLLRRWTGRSGDQLAQLPPHERRRSGDVF